VTQRGRPPAATGGGVQECRPRGDTGGGVQGGRPPGDTGSGFRGVRPPRAKLRSEVAAELDGLLADVDAELARAYPGERPGRQPVHTCYLPADRFEPDSAAQWGSAAMAALDGASLDDHGFADVMGLPGELAVGVRERVTAKLVSEPVEDLRLDFEDGYGSRPDPAEDADAAAGAAKLAAAIASGGAPAFVGLRCKSLTASTRGRAIGTLDIFIAGLAARGAVPHGLLLTLPKVSHERHVQAMTVLCDRLEAEYGLPAGQLLFEIQVETPQIVLGADGAATVARCVQAGNGRLAGLHFGTYDYSAALGIAAQYQSLDHPAADHAKQVLQLAAAGTGVRLSDGSSNVLPAGSRADVIAGWRLHAGLVRRSLERGFYQGWDLHPAQLVSRYAATYGFFLAGLDQACSRLREWTSRGSRGVALPGQAESGTAGTASRLEEPATAIALAGFLRRALDCGAVGDAEVADRTGLTSGQLAALSRPTSARLSADALPGADG
jgi:HpcH/HpaI aldolase/citrate lyase family